MTIKSICITHVLGQILKVSDIIGDNQIIRFTRGDYDRVNEEYDYYMEIIEAGEYNLYLQLKKKYEGTN